MSRPTRFLSMLLLVLLPLALACGSSMMSGQETMRGEVANARLENQRHLDAVLSADSLPAVTSEMGRHDAAMTAMMSNMDDAMDDMQHCTGPGMQHVMDMRGEMTGEMGAHDAAMRGSTSLGDARTEAQRHASAMGDMMDGMDGGLGDMDCGMR